MSRKWKNVVSLILVIALVFVMVPMTTVTPAAKSIAEMEADQEAIRAEIKRLEALRANLQKDLGGQLQELALLEEQLELKNAEIAVVQESIDDANAQISQKQADIEERQRQADEAFRYLKNRLNQVSKTGNFSSFQMVLSTDSYVDYLLKAKVMEIVSENDEKTIDTLEREMKVIAEEKEKLVSLRKTLEAQRDELKVLKDEIAVDYAAVDSKVASIQRQMTAFHNEIKKNEATEAQLEKDIADAINASSDPNLSYKGGTMYWPSRQCTILTSTFGGRWGSLHKGIDLACYGDATGKDIRAAADGVVIKMNNTNTWGSGWCSGYGYAVLVDHGVDSYGRQITTLYAHMSAVMVTVGQRVYGGSTQLGKVGDTGWSYGAHLHFEVRQDGTPVDPIGKGYVSVPR